MLITLPVLPAPFSSSLFPELTRRGKRKLKEALKLRDPHCIYCGRPVAGSKLATLDHLIPKSRGGGDTMDNLRLSCCYCNGIKADDQPAEWLQRMEAAVNRLRGVIAAMD